MKASEFKNLLIMSLDRESDPVEASRLIRDAGAEYSFSHRFSEKITDKLFNKGNEIIREVEFVRNLNFAFYRIALTGVAAIVLLLISIFLVEGSLSFDSFLGLGNSSDESIYFLLTGN